MNTENTNEMTKNNRIANPDSLLQCVWKTIRGLWGRAHKPSAKTPAAGTSAEMLAGKASHGKPETDCAKSQRDCANHRKNRPHRRPFHACKPVHRKPTYRPVASGATFLIDTANLIGAIGPEHAATRLANLREMLASAGHSVVFFWEYGAYTWTKAQQSTEEERHALKAFVSCEDVSLVSGESDLAILQTAQITPNSICLTRDRFNDYAETYPQIVGSSRHRSFSVARIAGMVTLSVFGLKDAIVLSKPMPQEVTAQERVVANTLKMPMTHDTVEKVALEAEKPVRRSLRPARRPGLYGCVDARLATGDGRKALKLLSQIARKDPSAYVEMASLYNEGDGVPADAHAAKRYARLAKKNSKALRLLERRQKRLASNRTAGLGFANLHGATERSLVHKLEQCALHKAERRQTFRLASRKQFCAMPRTFRVAA